MTTDSQMNSKSGMTMTQIADLTDRLNRLAKRREDEGIYTDAMIASSAATRIAALEAQLAERVRVKPLEWTPAANNAGKDGLWFVAIDVFGKKHEVIRSHHGQNGAGWTYGDTWYGTIDEAKEAAVDAVRVRILSALEATPAPMVTEAMVDVALKAFHSVGQYASERARIKAALTAAQEAGKP